MADVEPQLKDFESDLEKCEYLQRIATNYATGDGFANDDHYKFLRKYFLDRIDSKSLVPE